jgi:hypothetical protein
MSGYDQDLVLWSREQAAALRAAARGQTNLPIDFENVAEEIESLGRSDRRALASHITTILEHLMKLDASPAQAPRAGWRRSIRRARRQIARLIKESPSLNAEIPEMVAQQISDAREDAADALEEHGEQPAVPLDSLSYTADQVLED